MADNLTDMSSRERASLGIESLVSMIERNIEVGVWKPGAKLPTERELEKQLGLSRNTLRRGLRRLEDQGRIVRYVGRGSFIADVSANGVDFPAAVPQGQAYANGEAGNAIDSLLQKILDEKGYKYQVVNAGISGETTSGGIDRLIDVLRLEPKVTLLELGGNDGLRGISLIKSRDNLVQISRRLEAKGSKILLLGITLPRNYGFEYIRDFEGMYKGLATNMKYPLMPFVLEGVYNQKAMMQDDGIHPTAKGAAQVAKNVFKYLEPLLSK